MELRPRDQGATTSLSASAGSDELWVSYTFTPDLTLEAYAEPFATSGRYSAFGELAVARNRDLAPYAPVLGAAADSLRAEGIARVRSDADTLDLEVADFNVRSFRSNVFLRWE